ncbi:MAG: hypothetical protein GPOALKHO_000270 [Sodalis sp.]|nr:MAG: hypothetical protein GPOALKHO_000270 [Sodalis sp.]
MDVVAYQNQDLIYADLISGRIDAAFQNKVAGSEGFLKQSAGKSYSLTSPAVKDDKFFSIGTGETYKEWVTPVFLPQQDRYD